MNKDPPPCKKFDNTYPTDRSAFSVNIPAALLSVFRSDQVRVPQDCLVKDKEIRNRLHEWSINVGKDKDIK